MSGYAFQPVQMPDFGATLARSQQYGVNQLIALQQMRQLQEAQAKEDAYTQYGGDLASADPAARTRAAAALLRFNPQAFMEMLQNERDRNWDAPAGGAAPAAMPGAAPVSGDYLTRLAGVESGGDPNIQNPRSSATGLYQFIDGTWRQFAQENPQLFQGMNDQQILAQRTNPQLQQQAAIWYAQKNAAALRASGVEPSAPALALAHRFDGPVAARILQAPPNTPIASIVGDAVIRANPDLAGKTTGQVIGQAEQRFAATPVAGGGSGLPVVPGRDMARIELARREAARGNPYAMREWQMYVQEAQLMAKDNAVERVRLPDGSEVFVPRSQVAGMRSAPEPRPAAGNDAPGQAGETLRRLGPRVLNGTATQDEVEQWRQAYDAYTLERIDPTTNSRIPGRPETPQMRAAREALLKREAPDAVPAPGQPNAAPQLPAPGASAPIGTTGMVAEPPGGQGAQPRVETTASGSTRTVTPPRITPQAQEAARKLEVDAAGLSAAVQQFKDALRLYGAGRTGIQAFNPRSVEGARLNQAFENLKMALRGEAFANTGVLQPGENRMIDEILRNPRSLTGLLSSVDASNAQLDELLTFAEAKVNAARRAADLPPLTLRPQGGGSGNQQRRPLSSFQR